MKSNIVLLIILFITFSGGYRAGAQSNKGYPIIGQPCPNFILKDIHYFNGRSKVSLNDLRGKYVILDFWSSGCVSCVQSFPKLNKLQNQYRDKLQIISIGQEGPYIRPLFEKYRSKMNLIFPVAYDSILFNPPFKKVPGVPWCVWIDNKGVVRAVTSSTDVNNENIYKFINNKKFSFNDLSFITDSLKSQSYIPTNPFLIDGNGGVGISDTNFLYRSVLSQWKPGISTYLPSFIDSWIKPWVKNKIPKFETLKCPLLRLYTFAYFGEAMIPDSLYQKPIFKTRDSTIFKGLYTGDIKKYYCYSLIVPSGKANKEYFMAFMQNDLNNYFGYKVTIEVVDLPCLVLVVKNKRKVEAAKSDGENRALSFDLLNGLTAVNCSIKDLARLFVANTKQYWWLQVFDETGINENLDIRIKNYTTLRDVRNELNKYGLDIIYEKREQKAMIIMDP